MKVFIYCANSPPSPVLGSYFVTVPGSQICLAPSWPHMGFKLGPNWATRALLDVSPGSTSGQVGRAQDGFQSGPAWAPLTFKTSVKWAFSQAPVGTHLNILCYGGFIFDTDLVLGLALTGLKPMVNPLKFK